MCLFNKRKYYTPTINKQGINQKNIKINQLKRIESNLSIFLSNLKSENIDIRKNASLDKYFAILQEYKYVILNIFTEDSVEYREFNNAYNSAFKTDENNIIPDNIMKNTCGILIGDIKAFIDKIELAEEQKKYQFFISSTYKDLQEQRDVIARTIIRNDNFYIGMENFHAVNTNQLNYLKNNIAQSDYFVLVIGKNYGSIIKEKNISYTHYELKIATELKKPILLFICNNKSILTGEDEPIENQEKFTKFVEEAKSIANPCYFANNDQLSSDLSFSLHDIIKTYPQKGWVKCD